MNPAAGVESTVMPEGRASKAYKVQGTKKMNAKSNGNKTVQHKDIS